MHTSCKVFFEKISYATLDKKLIKQLFGKIFQKFIRFEWLVCHNYINQNL